MADRELTALGRLLEHARLDVLRISAREAARRTPISEARWRQIVTGVQTKGGGTVPVRPRPQAVVGMALAVGVDPKAALDAAGISASPESVAALVDSVTTASRREPPAALADEDVTREIERIKSLPLPVRTRQAMIRALIDLHVEAAAEAAAEAAERAI